MPLLSILALSAFQTLTQVASAQPVAEPPAKVEPGLDPRAPAETGPDSKEPKIDPQTLAPEIAKFVVREGYKVTVAVPRLDAARFMEFGPDGWLYVSRPRIGDIVALQDVDGDGVYDKSLQYIDSMDTVQAMCFYDNALWFAISGAIYKGEDTDGNGIANNIIEVTSDLPSGATHWWRSLLVTEDGIFTSIGDSGNINEEESTDRQKIWRFSHTGSDKTLWSSGVRNTEKLRLRPGTKEVWGIDHGSDSMGNTMGETAESFPLTDNNPPDELNMYEKGKFYGHPFITGAMWPRPEYEKREDIIAIAARTVAPKLKLGAHWAANGFTFVDPKINDATKSLPLDANGDIFAACRGSWNRSSRDGYQIVRILFDKDQKMTDQLNAIAGAGAGEGKLGTGGKPIGIQTIVSTLDTSDKDNFKPLARPVDCVQAPDGSILFTSDQPVGRIYRIKWVGTGK